MSIEQRIAGSARLHESVSFFGSGRLTVGEFATIEPYVTIDLGSAPAGRIVVGPRAKLKQGVVLRAHNGFIEIGTRASVGEYSVLAGHGGLTIGETTIIAGHCHISASGHIADGDVAIRFQGETAHGIEVEDDVWIGAHVVVQDGVRIGTGAVIGSGAVVTRTMPPSTVCFGVPCRPVHQRG